jgi:hypothetical protein
MGEVSPKFLVESENDIADTSFLGTQCPLKVSSFSVCWRVKR